MEDLDVAIRRHRTAHATITLERNGSAASGQVIRIEQKSHKLLLGSSWGNSSVSLANGELTGREKELAELRNHYFLKLFNLATLPFYWARFEPRKGEPQTQRIMAAARWYRDNGCVVKGHPLCWHTLAAEWLTSMEPAAILQAQLDRIQRDVQNFKGLIDMWDVVNEAVIMPLFDRYDNGITRVCREVGRIGLIRRTFEAAREANPGAVLLLNDFDVSAAYDVLIEGCRDAGIRIDVIGIQSHMHQGYWGPERTRAVLERFGRFNLPIHFTENTLVSGKLMPPEIVDLNDYQPDEWPSTPDGEERQAREVVLHYKTLLSHPSVQAISWWDLSDGGWLKAPAGLLRKDHSPKPAYEALLRLVKGEWWLAPVEMRTDAAGRFSLTGFLGEYELSHKDRKVSLTLTEPGDLSFTLSLA